MRTYEEIVDRINKLKPHDKIMGFKTPDLVLCLPYKYAKEFLRPEVTSDEWEEGKTYPVDRESIIKQMEEYMPYAWEQANNCRGISASRTMGHYSAWVWLVGDDLGDLNEYEYYGKDHLVRICEHYGWDHTQWDDGIREN